LKARGEVEIYNTQQFAQSLPYLLGLKRDTGCTHVGNWDRASIGASGATMSLNELPLYLLATEKGKKKSFFSEKATNENMQAD